MDKLYQNISEKVKLITKLPSIQSVCISNKKSSTNALNLIATYSQSSVETSETVKYQRQFSVRDGEVVFEGTPQNLDSKWHVCYSPSLNKKVVFRAKSSEKNCGHLLDIWSNQCLQSSIDLESAKKHGAPYLSGDLASFDWSDDESRFLYMAERKRPPTASFFDPWSSSEAVRGSESRYYEDWGEQMCGQHQSVVVIIDLTSGTFRVLESDDNVTLGQARWLGQQSIFAVAFPNSPKRLGLIYCTTRPSHLVRFSLQDDQETLEPVSTSSSATPQSCRSLRVSPDQRYLVWLQTDAGGPHHKGARLLCLDRESGHQKVLIDTVDVADPSDGFCGIYTMFLPDQCFLSDHQLCFSTQQGTRWTSYTVNILDGQRTKLSGDDYQVLAVAQDVLVGVASSLLQPHQLVVKTISSVDQWTTVNLGEQYPAFSGDVLHLVLQRDAPECFSDVPYTAMLATPTAHGGTATPLIVFPHGGPHGVMVDAWSQHVALLVSLGLAVLLVNYRGSAGAGERALHALPSRVGSLDVGDCEHAVRHVLSLHQADTATVSLDAQRVGAYGGSHGGFLVCHLSGQFPEMVKAVVARNPVCDIAAMATATDIPDWNFVESGAASDAHRYHCGEVPTAAQLTQMLDMSPISHVQSVSAPTLLLLGTVDRRVVPSQALFYHHALRARGVCTDVCVYDDCHPLAKAAVNGDVMVHSAVWFCNHLHYDPPTSS